MSSPSQVVVEPSPSVAPAEPEAVCCVSCGTVLRGDYCHACGERRITEEHRTIRHFLREGWSELTSVDGKLWQSLWQLTRRPGMLTNAYLEGRRRAYLRPIRLFLICNIIYFFIQPYTGYTGYNTPLDSQMYRQTYSDVFELDTAVETHLAATGESLERYEERYNWRSSTFARTLVIAIVPVFAFGLALLYGPRRHLPLRHLVFATHFFAWILLYVMVLFLGAYQLTFLGLNAAGVLTIEMVQAWPGMVRMLASEHPDMLLIILFLAVGARRVYGAGWASAIGKGFVGYLWMVLCIVMYRLLLFWLTFWTV
jgi:hypothetical protein